MGTVLYFAYGSNMLTAWLQHRTHSARPVGLADLAGWRLAFHKRSMDGSGKCDIVLGGAGDLVIGVVFELDEGDLPALDKAEGVGKGYERMRIVVHRDHHALECWTYKATRVDPSLNPYGWYRQLVLAGLLEHGAPERYIDLVRVVKSIPDPGPHDKLRVRAFGLLREFRKSFPALAPKLGEEDDT